MGKRGRGALPRYTAEQIASVIWDLTNEKERKPTLKELNERLGYSHTSTCNRRLKAYGLTEYVRMKKTSGERKGARGASFAYQVDFGKEQYIGLYGVKPLDNERWKTFDGCSGKYAVSTKGRVARYNDATEQWEERRQHLNNASGGGYPIVAVGHIGGISTNVLVHILVYRAFIELVKGECVGMDIAHKNGLRTDCRVENLELRTHKQSVRSRWEKKGR